MLECQQGYFGYNCEENCSKNCGDPGRCDRIKGNCIGDCQAGWAGAMCENGEFKCTLNIPFDGVAKGCTNIKSIKIIKCVSCTREPQVSHIIKQMSFNMSSCFY